MNSVVRYYEDTWLDYRVLWTDSHSRGMHFGYFDGGVRTHAEALTNTNRILADVAGLVAGQSVLDAGCGVGGSSCWLASNRDVHCVGITPVPMQVKKARTLAAARGLEDRTTFVCGDYTRTPFPDCSFDAVWALESLCHAKNKKRFYQEAARILRPGGRLVVAEYMRSSRQLGGAGEAMLAEWCDGWCMPDLDTSEEHMASAAIAGFRSASVADFTFRVERSLRRLYRMARFAAPFDKFLHWCGVRNETQHRNVTASWLQYDALRSGLWQYGVLCATKPRMTC